jgi:CoA:oxalate CoA-transferase
MRPLEGVRVLDLTRVVSGPVAGRILSDLGADVVKVEPPEGDITRIWGEERHGVAGFFMQQNAGKRNISIDLRKPAGVQLVIDLATRADVVIENFRGGVMDRMGIGWAVLSAANPKLVMCSISGFGQTGPEAHRQAYASVIQAESGLVHRHATQDGRPPTDPITSFADYNSGLHGTIALLAALHAVKTTNVGTHIDMAMLDAMMFTDDYMHHAIDGSEIVRLGGEYWQTADGNWFEIAGQFKFVWAQISTACNLVDPTPKSADLETKITNRRALVREFIATLADAEAAIAMAETAGLPWGRYNSPEQALVTPTALHRGIVTQVDDRSGSGGQRGIVQSPYRFNNYESGVRGSSPHRGEHNAEVLTEWLKTPPAQITELLNTQVLLTQP